MLIDKNTWYWLAGLLEGEGSFMAPIPAVPRKPRVSLEMTDQDVVTHAANLFELTCYLRKKATERRKALYAVHMQGSTAIKVMRTIQPVMGQRRQQQIEKAITKSERDYESIALLDLPSRNSEHELYWLAGLLEGEGSFFVANKNYVNKPRVRLWMTDEDIIARVAQIWGLKYQSYDRDEIRKIAYMVTLLGTRALNLMHQLKPLMGIRRQGQIEKAIASYDPDFLRKSHIKKAKLEPDQVREIRKLIKNGEKYHPIAEKYGVKHTVIVDIARRKTWAWLE